VGVEVDVATDTGGGGILLFFEAFSKVDENLYN
jgi:hypothetical protein